MCTSIVLPQATTQATTLHPRCKRNARYGDKANQLSMRQCQAKYEVRVGAVSYLEDEEDKEYGVIELLLGLESVALVGVF
jgi:hypothetical protein